MVTMPRNTRADETVLHYATPTHGTLRATIPAFVTDKLGLKKGDLFQWHLMDDGRIAVTVVKPPAEGKVMGVG